MFYVIKMGWHEEETTCRVDGALKRALAGHPHVVVDRLSDFARMFPEPAHGNPVRTSCSLR